MSPIDKLLAQLPEPPPSDRRGRQRRVSLGRRIQELSGLVGGLDHLNKTAAQRLLDLAPGLTDAQIVEVRLRRSIAHLLPADPAPAKE